MNNILLYNIWLEVSALVFNLLIWIFYRLQYKNKSEKNHSFEKLTVSVFFLTLTDIISAILISQSELAPKWVDYFANGANYLFAGVASFLFVRYIRLLVDERETIASKIEILMIILFCITEIINPFFGFYFSFDDSGYIHGPYYLLELVFPYLYVIIATILLYKYHSKLNKRELVGSSGYVLIMLIAATLQIFIIPKFLITGFSSTITLFIIFMLMETPDYYRLMETIEELDKAKKEANKANKTKSALLATVSHEIRTPLNAVLGMNEMILREESNPEIFEYAKNIETSGNTLLSMINDILDFSKIEAGMLTIKANQYDTYSLIKKVENLLKAKAQNKGLIFYTNCDENLPSTLYGDDVRISQIIINLVNNAIKYTDKGWVELVIGYYPTNTANLINLVITVKDTGKGIKPEDIPKLFSEFERLDEENNKGIEGTGLGLSITNYLVHAMEGTIDVESSYGNGSVFKVIIPQNIINATPISIVTNKKEISDSRRHENNFKAPSAKILAVDDNQVNLLVLYNLLKKTDIQVSTALSGQEALTMIQKEKFDIILLDHLMPVMDGVETLHAAKEIDAQMGNKPVYIVVTANAQSDAEKYYLSEGFDDYLTKPIDSKILEKKIFEFLPKDKVICYF